MLVWVSSGGKGNDEKTAQNCNDLLDKQQDTCQLDCSKLDDDSLKNELCPRAGGNLIGQDAYEECRAFRRKSKTRDI